MIGALALATAATASAAPARTLVVGVGEVNSPAFWRPQRDAPKEYALLLGRCWDLLHAMRPNVNVVSSTAPRHHPLGFIAQVGAARAALRRARERPLARRCGRAGAAAARRADTRVLQAAARRRVLQLPARRRAPPRRLAVGPALGRLAPEAV